MRWWLRLRRLRKNKAVFWPVVGSLVCIGWFYVAALLAFTGTTADARSLWFGCMFVQLCLITLLSPLLAASAVSQERERQTWETLQTTPLTGRQILGGKWLARQVPVVMLLVLLLPPVLGCAFVGDLVPSAILYVIPLLLLTSIALGMIGLTCSFLLRRTMTSVTVALLITATLCLGPVLITNVIGVMGFDFHSGDHQSLLAVSPFYVLFKLMRWLQPTDNPYHTYWWQAESPEGISAVLSQYVLVSVIVITLCFVFLTNRYRKALLS